MSVLLFLIKSVIRISIHHTGELQQFIKLHNRNASFMTHIYTLNPKKILNEKKKITVPSKMFLKGRIILRCVQIYLLA